MEFRIHSTFECIRNKHFLTYLHFYGERGIVATLTKKRFDRMQVIDGLYNGYGDKLSEYEFSEAASNLFPKHYISDIATKIIGEFFDNKTLGRCCQTSKRWNKVINHFVALKKIELYEKISHPKDWNAWQTKIEIYPEEMKEAFRTLPLNIDLDKCAVAYWPAKINLNNLIIFLKEKSFFNI